MMLVSLNTNIPRYFIQHYLGERELGIFAAMFYLMVAGNTIIAALGQSASPRLAMYNESRDLKAFRRPLGWLVELGAALRAAGILMALVLGREILTALYRPACADPGAPPRPRWPLGVRVRPCPSVPRVWEAAWSCRSYRGAVSLMQLEAVNAHGCIIAAKPLASVG